MSFRVALSATWKVGPLGASTGKWGRVLSVEFPRGSGTAARQWWFAFAVRRSAECRQDALLSHLAPGVVPWRSTRLESSDRFIRCQRSAGTFFWEEPRECSALRKGTSLQAERAVGPLVCRGSDLATHRRGVSRVLPVRPKDFLSGHP